MTLFHNYAKTISALLLPIACFLSITIVQAHCFAQSQPNGLLNSVISSINTSAESLGIEKLYLQTDKPAYQTGDTLWFKAYLLNAATLQPSTKSGLLYVEITSENSRLVKRIMLPVYNGLTYGNLILNTEDVPQGGYVLRAYTNWMRNFGERSIYQKHFYVSAPAAADSWLLNYNAATTKTDGKDNVRLKLQVQQLDKDPVRVREMQLSLNDGKRTLLRSAVQTDLTGQMDVNFNLPQNVNSRNLTVSLADMRKGADARLMHMPLLLNRPQNIDLQFMPEGGNLVAGVQALVAFKALTEDGQSTHAEGAIYDSKQTEVATFASTHKGIGTFNFLPIANETYTARLKLPDGTAKSYPLPKVAGSGITLKVNNLYEADSCEVVISGTPDSLVTGKPYYLIAQARGVVYYGASFTLKPTPTRLWLAKNLLPTGITRILLVANNKTVLNERLIYIDHADQLNIKVTANKPAYALRDSVSLGFEVTDKTGNPVAGSFSLSVTDNGQVKIDSLGQNQINTHLHLSSYLNGYIEDPGYYRNPASNAQKWQHTDQLLLVHGWVGYNWDNYFKPAPTFAFEPEQQFSIQGKVTNAFNKPVANSGITLFSKKPLVVTDTTSNDKGIFRFTGIYPADTAVYFLQARNKRGKIFNVGIEMNEFAEPKFSAPTQRLIPWYVNIDTAQLRMVNKQKQLKDEQDRASKGTLLKAVEVKAKKAVKGSKNLNGTEGADMIIDEAELAKAGRKSLRELLVKKIPRFHLMYKEKVLNYVIGNSIVYFIIDGIELDYIYHSQVGLPRHQFYDQYLDYYDAEEIKGIEVMTSPQYGYRYLNEFFKGSMISMQDVCFIEITTRSGAGPFVKKAIGTYVYRPMPFALPKAFYSPKYKPNALPNNMDIRSTIHWEPNVITGSDGKATVSFYTADVVSNYTILVEGADLQGNVGSKTANIKVDK